MFLHLLCLKLYSAVRTVDDIASLQRSLDEATPKLAAEFAQELQDALFDAEKVSFFLFYLFLSTFLNIPSINKSTIKKFRHQILLQMFCTR